MLKNGYSMLYISHVPGNKMVSGFPLLHCLVTYKCVPLYDTMRWLALLIISHMFHTNTERQTEAWHFGFLFSL